MHFGGARVAGADRRTGAVDAGGGRRSRLRRQRRRKRVRARRPDRRGALALRGGRAVTSSPAVREGSSIVGSRDGAYFALDAATGTRALARHDRAPTRRSPGGSRAVTCTPRRRRSRTDSRCWAGAMGRCTRSTRGRERCAGGSGPRGGCARHPRSRAAVVYVGSMDGTLYALELASGRLVWRYDTEGHTLASAKFGFDRRTIQSSPAVAGGRVFVGSRDGHLYAIDAATGRLAWAADHEMSWVNSSPAVAGDLVFAGSSDNRFVQAVDVRYGQGALAGEHRAAGLVVARGGGGRGLRGRRDRHPLRAGPRDRRRALAVSDRAADLFVAGAGRTGCSTWATTTGRSTRSGAIGRGFAGRCSGTALLRGPTGSPATSRCAPTSPSGDTRCSTFPGSRGSWRERVADRAPSVVVFAMDHLPSAVAARSGRHRAVPPVSGRRRQGRVAGDTADGLAQGRTHRGRGIHPGEPGCGRAAPLGRPPEQQLRRVRGAGDGGGAAVGGVGLVGRELVGRYRGRHRGAGPGRAGVGGRVGQALRRAAGHGVRPDQRLRGERRPRAELCRDPGRRRVPPQEVGGQAPVKTGRPLACPPL